MTEEKDKKIELTEEQKRSFAWMQYVWGEVNTLLAMFLPVAKSGTVGVKYNKHVTEMNESGPEYDLNKADGVEIRLVFDFEKTLDIPKESKE